jgi:prevent-host-death family protein
MLHMERVGVRDLRLNASSVLRRVEAGETVEITSRGRLVARIVPIHPSGGMAQLIAQGLARPPTEEGDLLDIEPLEPVPGVPLPSEVLAAMRADER